ncbi:MAG: response regulator [Bacteroidetes bacterium SB0662_bin_6]|nr:response regulator [Bacteroidetes bacterium SB0668_bin_1]MYE04671.1 response regulator [Bacteroidetes bacterium SB0662_bin_6]
MKYSDESGRANEVLSERTSRLCAAMLRIGASLELDVVLQEIVENARELADARYGIITTTDATGNIEDVVMSGFTPEESQQMLDWPDGPRLFEHFRELPGVLRLADLSSYVDSLGYSADLMLSKTFQGTPMHHQGRYVGNFFLAGKQNGPEFTSEDEEILVIFASQAAMAIANARAHRNEQQARAYLETLVDTSPVGVVVLGTRTGNPVLFNQEARRLVEGIHVPDRTEEQLLDILTCRRADGRDITFGECMASLKFGNSETVRGETVELSVGDGRSVKILINATPIHSGDGITESLVVTMQDLAPLEELERLRAEFLGMVSHELQAPLASIKGSAATILEDIETLSRDEILQFFRIVNGQANHMQSLIGDLLDNARIDTGTLSVFPEPSEVSDLVERARTSFLSGGSQHTVLVDLPMELPRIMADSRRIVQVLHNLFSNAARNSPPSSPVNVAAHQEDAHVVISVSDKGRGIPEELLPHLFEKYTGFSKDAEQGTEGFGLGLAICKGLIEAHGGRIRAESDGVGLGARFTFTVPIAEEAITDDVVPDNGSAEPETASESRRILVVDDDPQALRYIRDVLTSAGYSPIITNNPRELSRLIRMEKPDLVLLDLVFPGTDGIELMENVSELTDQPVIFLSAYKRDETIVQALEVGAVDYIVKPFSPNELTARIQSALRRRTEPDIIFALKDLRIDYDQHRVTVADRTIRLTTTEYRLLRALSLGAGKVVTYDQLLRLVWSNNNSTTKENMRTFVKTLRDKLGDDPAEPKYILNVRGAGYKMYLPD